MFVSLSMNPLASVTIYGSATLVSLLWLLLVLMVKHSVEICCLVIISSSTQISASGFAR